MTTGHADEASATQAADDPILLAQASTESEGEASAGGEGEGEGEGERVAVAGGITSWVRDPGRREILHDLDVAARGIFETQGKTPAFDRVFKGKANLSRMWYDD